MRRVSRLTLTALALAILAGSGCQWFGKKNNLYAQSPESRPLEVPPDLDRPAANNAMQIPEGGTSVSASQLGRGRAIGTTSSATGFAAPGTREAVFARVGQVLAATPGLTVASTANLLGTYDVAYEGSNFLLRVNEVQGGAYVSAVDPRGQPAAGAAPAKLIAALKAAIAP